MPRVIRVALIALAVALLAPGRAPVAAHESTLPDAARVARAFQAEGIALNTAEAQGILKDVHLALREAQAHGIGNSKVDFAAVQIASDLGLPLSGAATSKRQVLAALGALLRDGGRGRQPEPVPPPAWGAYFDSAVNLWHQPDFMRLVTARGFHPVKISWEDIGRHEGSVWGDRISDVGIWVRRDEADPASARLALSVRRDSNFRDKVLMVPAERIKVHQRVGDRTIEKTLPQRLRELGIASAARDRNVIVSNQFAIVPVPARSMHGAWPEGVPPRAAFTFSIFPYGSTNLVITDVIEGSHEAIVGPGQHQLLFANVDGARAPFTASRAEDRQDLLKLERELKAQGMDVDVQRYYLIQVPLRRDVAGLQPSNMGTPPFRRAYEGPVGYPAAPAMEGGVAGGVVAQSAPAATAKSQQPMADMAGEAERRREPGLARVAIGHGESEGPYFAGAGFRGARAEEPIRVTVVYFVTPVGQVSAKDMETFASAFAQWDGQAIWGGSFVVKQ
ncbi:MAG: hypothetical protein NDJ94_02705 [Vicinamibacteria bacterium]|jgi:hypothetical protein|nr:hypothetical protein [Vicinamibacteria bacterium]